MSNVIIAGKGRSATAAELAVLLRVRAAGDESSGDSWLRARCWDSWAAFLALCSRALVCVF